MQKINFKQPLMRKKIFIPLFFCFINLFIKDMTTMTKHIFFFFAAFLSVSCSRYPSDVEQALTLAADTLN